MTDRIDDFTRRNVGKRERLFTPECDPGANWDFFVFLIIAFGTTMLIGVMMFAAYIAYLLTAWP